MLLSYPRLIALVDDGVITAHPSLVNAASIDLTLGAEIQICDPCVHDGDVVDLAIKENIKMVSFQMEEHGFVIRPGQFILAHTEQFFNLPDTIAAEFKLKSSMARNGLNHCLAGWCDPGFNSSQLTLEFYNVSNQNLLIRPGMKCGQIVLWECEDAGDGSYAKVGQYNGQTGATTSKGIR